MHTAIRHPIKAEGCGCRYCGHPSQLEEPYRTMTKRIVTSEMPLPVTVAGLRNHFAITYHLDEEQIEIMLRSTARSLEQTLAAAETALSADDGHASMAKAGHALKGLFLNMGEEDWAAIARELERAATAGEDLDYALVVSRLAKGMRAVTGCGDGG